MPEACRQKSGELAFDVTKQFLAIAFAGIAFVVGLALNSPGAISPMMFWFIVGALGVSAVVGLVFFMHSISLLTKVETYDVNTDSIRGLAGLQIALVFTGTVLLAIVVHTRMTAFNKPAADSIEIQFGSGQSIKLPIDFLKDKVVSIDASNARVQLAPAKPQQ